VGWKSLIFIRWDRERRYVLCPRSSLFSVDPNFASQFRDAFAWDEHQGRLYTPLGLPVSPRKKDIDIVQNAMVLRGDVHSQFDEYQFGFVTYRDPTLPVGPT
jgi:hypothetical protein